MSDSDAKVISKLEDVTFTYRRAPEPALEDINLEIKEGEMILLLGPLNAGKSTLLRLLNGLIPCEFPGQLEGTVTTGGLNTKENIPQKFVDHVGLVLDDPSVQVFNLTVEDDIAFGPLNLNLSLEEIEERTNETIELMRLEELREKHPKELSGGEQQKLALAGVLALQPDLIALDEPISMLDPIGKQEVIKWIGKLNEEKGIACIITESGSDLEDIIQFASRVIVLEKGKIRLDGSPYEVLNEIDLEELGVGIPPVSRLYFSLKENFDVGDQPFISVDEATERIKDLIKSGKIFVEKKEKKVSRGEKGPEQIVLSASGVDYIYDDGTVAVKGIDLDLWEGEMVALIGQNGSGKSTFSLALAGEYDPLNPEAWIITSGCNICESTSTETCRAVNYVFQNPNIQLFRPIAREEVEFALDMLEVPEEEKKEKVDEMLDLFGLDGDEDIDTMSLDRKTLTAIASVFVLEPKIFIVDEPTSGLDWKGSVKLMTTLQKLRDQGHAVIVITHDMKLAYQYSDRVLVMNDGNVMLDGPPEEVFSNVELLQDMYIQPPQITQIAHNLRDHGVPTDICTIDQFMESIRGE